jgi:hypothetical protein
MKGRIVRVQCGDEAGLRFMKLFDVAIEDPDAAIAAVRAAHPVLAGYLMEAHERLSPTAVAFLDLDAGEIRERWSLEPD